MLRFTIAVVATALIGFAATGRAATIAVNDVADASGGATCTLGNAIDAANTNAAVGGCPAGDPGATRSPSP
ncbi:MAG TPA: hypothetical protein VFD92_13790 [Candidatus Binatia bacterium]|nr:hypothetical protein [Candidatus Binatia bacterium]